MNSKFILFSIGKLLQLLAIVLLAPFSIAVFEARESLPDVVAILNQCDVESFLFTIVTSGVIGTILSKINYGELRGNLVREGFSIVTFGWIALTLFGAIPLFWHFINFGNSTSNQTLAGYYTEAFFEIMSGFTTTGSTILTNIEVLPKSILFWRSLTHWLGGMGIVTLAMSIFPAFGVTAYQMFRGEVPGPTAERIRPRLHQTAAILWGVYALLTLIETLLLYFGGMTLFDAICHAFGTMATGGFSTKNASIAAYHSWYIDLVITIFMFMAGMNFMLHYAIIFRHKPSVLLKDSEFRFYTTVIVFAILLFSIVLKFEGLADRSDISRSFRNAPLTTSSIENKTVGESEKISSIPQIIRYSSFQILSIVTTTGYCTADFDVWPNILRTFLVILMFFGGSAGSTGGGIKMVRIMVVLKAAWREVKKMVHPRLVMPLKFREVTVNEKQISNIMAFFVIFISLFGIFSLLMSLIIPDVTTAVTSVVATMCNIGPGLSGVGATENYAWIPSEGKWILSLAMLMGRLEIYTVIIALMPSRFLK